MSDAVINALLAERHGYVVRGLANRVAAVDAELARLGHKVADEPRAVEAAAVEPGERAVAAKPRKRG